MSADGHTRPPLWADQASIDRHMAAANVGAAIAGAGPMFAAPPEILTFARLL